jgi:hypothetical protein
LRSMKRKEEWASAEEKREECEASRGKGGGRGLILPLSVAWVASPCRPLAGARRRSHGEGDTAREREGEVGDGLGRLWAAPGRPGKWPLALLFFCSFSFI